MAQVRVTQRHRAVVEQEDLYHLSDNLLGVLADLPEDKREEFVEQNGTMTSTTSEIDELLETVEVRVAW